MNVTVKWEGSNITTSTLNYTRQSNICTGISTLDLVVSGGTERNFEVWDTIIVYELGNKVGTFNIGSVERTAPGGTYIIACQDDSKRLTDYFISDPYEVEYVTTTRYWLEFFLDMTGTSYSINTASYGNNVAPNTVFGMQPAYDVILTLLQMSGWYMYFDSDGTCQIGKLNSSSSVSESFSGDEIIEMSYRKNDKMLRNRAVVWGAGNTETGEVVFADTSVITAWTRSGGDYRTVVYSNPAIETIYAAYTIAYQILAELSLTIPEKSLVVAGLYPDLTVGDKVSASSNFMRFNGMITTLVVSVDNTGAVTALTLDQRCPRIFGYYAYNDFVYIGTDGAGVWRKPLESTTWVDYSTGITDLSIKDLSVYDGLLACVTKNTGELFIRHTTMDSWFKYIPPGFEDITASGIIVTSGVLAQACSIHRNYSVNGLITAAYTLPGSGLPYSGAFGIYDFPASGNRSWVIGVDLYGNQIYNNQVKITLPQFVGYESYDIAVLDLETNLDGNNILSVIHNGPITHIRSSGEPPNYNFGYANLYGEAYMYGPNLDTHTGRFIYVHMPEPTSGIVVEWQGDPLWPEEGIVPSGYLVVSESFYTDGSPYISDSFEDYGKVFSFGDLTSTGRLDIGEANVITEDWDESVYVGDKSTTCPDLNLVATYSYRIDDTHISKLNICNTGSVVHTVEIKILTFDEDDGSYTFSSPVCSKELEETGLTANLIRYSSGLERYYFILTASGDEIIKAYMFDMVTGICEVTTLYEGDSYYYKDWFPDQVGSRSANSILCCFSIYPTTPVSHTKNYTWSLYSVLANVNGSVSSSHVDISLVSRDDLEDFSAKNTVNSKLAGYSPTITLAQICCENPSTGVGIGKIIEERYFYLYPNDGSSPSPIDLTQVVDATVSLPRGQITINNIYLNYIDLSIAESPEWMAFSALDPATSYSHYFYPTFSRNLDRTPVVFPFYNIGSSSYSPALVDPINWASYTTINEFPDEIASPEIYYSSCMMDDLDDLIYITIGQAGGPNIPCGYNINGVLEKILLPTYADWSNAITFLQDKSLEGSSTKISFFIASGALLTIPSQLKTCILFHEPIISGEFTTIYEGNNPIYVEAGKGTPTVIYKHPPLSELYSGGFPGDFELSSILLGSSFLNELDTFETIYPGCSIYDARVFDLQSTGLDFMMASGGEFIPSDLDRYIGIAGGKKGLLMFDSLLEESGFSTIQTFGTTGSGVVTHLDFTNNHTKPYVFCCLNDVTSSGITASGRFYQRDETGLIFEDHSINLPGAVITIIRADDRM